MNWNASRSQIGGLTQDMVELRGDTPSPSFIQRQPILARWGAGLTPVRQEKQELEQFVHDAEARWGKPTTDVDDAVFRTEKAIALTRYNRTPDEVTETYVHAAGKVDGQEIAPRNIFVQRWKPIGTPTGKVMVLGPGFLESGRNFYEQIQLLNRQGVDVLVMDQQWAGLSDSRPGAIDRGFGIARDTAAVTAYATQLADKAYANLPGKQVVVAGNSMGAGPGVVGALTLNDAGLIDLAGPQMPKGLNAVVEAPYFATSRNLINSVLTAMGHIPLINMLPLRALGVPILSQNPQVLAKNAQHSTIEDTRGRPSAFLASTADIARIRELIASGRGPQGHVWIVAPEGDLLADPGATRAVAHDLGSHATLVSVPTKSHVLEEDPQYQGVFVDLTRKATGS